MPYRIVQSKQNGRLKQLRKALAQPGRDERGLAGIEGPNLLKEALRAGLKLDCVFAAEGSERLIEEVGLAPGTEVLLVAGELLRAALATETPQLVAALVETPEWSWDFLLARRRNSPALVVVLAGLQDPGNVGTILRSAEAFGANGVVALPGTVSTWNPKSVRASAGSVFRLPVIAADADECLARLRAAGLKIWTTAMDEAEDADHADLTGPIALILGNEGNGVAEELAAAADGTLTIPCPGPVESLNASIAASVLLYEASRQRGVRR